MNQSLPWVPIWIVFSIALTPQVRATQPLAPSSAENLIDETVLRSHVAFLADDALAGRDSGTDGLRKAAAYSVKAFQEMGLEPFGDIDPETGKRDFFQRFSINTAPVLADDQNEQCFSSKL